MFVNREKELAFLNGLLTRSSPGLGQLVLVYGRRRVGKTLLLEHWAENRGLPFTYWVADKEPGPLQRRGFATRLIKAPEEDAPVFDS